ncbi:sulfite exporter TauE/SafE family protein [Alkalihalobacterium chitinilyticum]|uniref:Probable membrane transporter protein n=1 Tax=Alkalihalobacterium chitinilyticum TaxID=2980103 RepID=A0ABT5VE48_9BACI|nr:sulfite exporter TauE/SafE family protein [Alkalihalobacterium chitinilyticum]MDE5412753.1 sulfite exporter TauE/SafE family protein [Alkalihalobacterium chitinilyticum]
MLAPLLLILGTPPTVAIGTSLMLSLATSLIGSAAHLRLKNIRWRVAGIISVAGMIAVQFTQPYVLFLESRGLDDFLIPLVFIVLLLSFALFLWIKRPEKEPHTEKKLIMPEYIYFIGIGLIAGVFSVMLGVSGGFIIVPLLIGLLRFPVKTAVGTSLASVVLIVLLGFVKYSLTTPIEYMVGLLLIAGTLFGSPLGARLTNFLTNNEMKKLLSFLYLSLALSMAIRLFFPPAFGVITLLLYFLAFLTYLIYKQKEPLTQ